MPEHRFNLNRTNDVPLGERGEATRMPAPKPVTSYLEGLALTAFLQSPHYDFAELPVAKLTQITDPRQSASVPGCNAEVDQTIEQENLVDVDGHAWISLELGGRVRGFVESVELGEITGAVRQSNAAHQTVSIGGTEHVTAMQAAAQGNAIDVEGNIGVTLCVHGNYFGKIRDLEAGQVVGEIDQRNHLVQKLTFAGTVPADFAQEATQANLVEACGSLDVMFKVGRQFNGTLQDVDLGLIAANIRQDNSASQSANGKGGDGLQSLLQANGVQVMGDVDVGVKIEQSFSSNWKGIDIGLITGEIIQRNHATQTGFLHADATKPVEAEQSASQANLVIAEGTVDAQIDICGFSYGRIEDVEIGLITADITQINRAAQSASSSGSRTGTTTDQEILQQNIVEVYADLEVDILVDGDFRGRIRDVEIGLLTGGIEQVNEAKQIAQPTGPALQTQVAAQENRFRLDLIDDVDISIVVEGGFNGVLDGLTVGLIFAEVEQGNFSFQKTSGPEGGMSARMAAPDLSQFTSRSYSWDEDGRLDLDIDIMIDAENADDFSDLFVGIEVVDLLPTLKDALWA
jgi:hypothetical protein